MIPLLPFLLVLPLTQGATAQSTTTLITFEDCVGRWFATFRRGRSPDDVADIFKFEVIVANSSYATVGDRTGRNEYNLVGGELHHKHNGHPLTGFVARLENNQFVWSHGYDSRLYTMPNITFTGVRGYCGNHCGVELNEGEYKCNGELDCAANPACVAYEIGPSWQTKSDLHNICTTNSKVTTGTEGGHWLTGDNGTVCYLKATPEMANSSYGTIHIVLLVFGFLFAFCFCFCSAFMGRTCYGPDWKEYHIDVDDGERGIHPVKGGIWLPVIVICILTAVLWHAVLNPVASNEHCDRGLMVVMGGAGDLAGLILGIVICCCVVRFRPKQYDAAGYKQAQQDWQQHVKAVAEQLSDSEAIEITIKPGPVQVQLSKGYHLSHIIKHLPYEQPADMHNASLSYGGTPLDKGPQSLSARSLRELESSLENGAILHLTGAALRPDCSCVLPEPTVGPEVLRVDFVKPLLAPEALRCHHVFAASSYEVACCDDRSRVEMLEGEMVRREDAAEKQQGIRKEEKQRQQEEEEEEPNAPSASLSPMSLPCLLTEDLSLGVPVALPVGLPGSPDDNFIPDGGVGGGQLAGKEDRKGEWGAAPLR